MSQDYVRWFLVLTAVVTVLLAVDVHGLFPKVVWKVATVVLVFYGIFVTYETVRLS